MGNPFTSNDRALLERLVGRIIEAVEPADDGAYILLRITHPGITEVLELRIEADGAPLNADEHETWLTLSAERV